MTAVWGAVVGFGGRWKDRPDLARTTIGSSYALAVAMIVASLALWKGLVGHDFNIEYVWAYTSRNLPNAYVFTAFWAGQKGSLLFWCLVLSIFGALAQAVTSRRHEELMPYVAAVVNTVAAFFLLTMIFGGANPFERMPVTPPDGNGLNPQLQNPGMVIHPPMLYLGYISITIPFAFAMAALISGSSTPAGSTPSASGPCSPGSSSRSGSRSACGGPTSSWGGAATGPGIRWRTRASCPGSP
jgi:cytochrome c-type biogenesis protein CcmF